VAGRPARRNESAAEEERGSGERDGSRSCYKGPQFAGVTGDHQKERSDY